jgi:hypothetical protein
MQRHQHTCRDRWIDNYQDDPGEYRTQASTGGPFTYVVVPASGSTQSKVSATTTSVGSAADGDRAAVARAVGRTSSRLWFSLSTKQLTAIQ